MVKTRLQNQTKAMSSSGASLKYKNGLHCFRTIVREEGVRGLYRGLPANLVGITPEKAIKLAVNDYAREFFSKRQHAKDVRDGKVAKDSVADADALSIPLGMLAGKLVTSAMNVKIMIIEILFQEKFDRDS